MRQRGALKAKVSQYLGVIVPEDVRANVKAADVVLPAVRREPFSRKVILRAAAIWLVTRFAMIVLSYYSVALFPHSEPVGPSLLMHRWQAFDGNWYIDVSRLGYWGVQPTAFFPLYPLLINLLTFFLGETHRLLAAMLISNLGTLLAFIGLALLAVQEYGAERAGTRTVKILAALPFAFFFFAPYTDGTFLGFATCAFLCARRGSWRWVALWAFLAALVRPTGAILLPALIWEYGRQRGWWQAAFWRTGRWREQLRPKALVELAAVVVPIPLALGLFVGYVWLVTGHPLAVLNSHRIYWNRQKAPQWETFASMIGNLFAFPFASKAQGVILLDLTAVVAVAVITLVMIRKIPFAFTIYVAGLLYLSTYSPEPTSPVLIDAAGRFMMAAFPVWLILANWAEDRPWLETLIVSTGYVLQTIAAIVFFSGVLIE